MPEPGFDRAPTASCCRRGAGRKIIQLAVDDWTLEKLMTFDAEAAELEDEGDGEPDADDEEDGPRSYSSSCGRG